MQFSRFLFASLPLVCGLSPAIAAHANPPASDDAGDGARDTIVVSATRTPAPLSSVGASVSVIDADTIRSRQTAAVVDLLRSVPGVSFVRNGGIGTSTSVSIRGADTDHTVVLVDGVKLNDPSSPGGGFNFGTLLTDNLDRIEVVRGSQSVLWGSQAIGGVVNMVTVEPTTTPTARLTGEYGWRDTGRVTGTVAGKYGPVSASLGGGYYRSGNISAFSEARGGKERDPFRHYGVNGKLRIAASDAVSIDLRGWYSDSKTDIDGFPAPKYAFADTKEVGLTKEFVGYAGVNAALFGDRFRNRFAYTRTDTTRHNIDYTPATPLPTFDSTGRNERLEYQGTWLLDRKVTATFGAESEKSRFSSSSYGAPATERDTRIDSAYGQIMLTPVDGLTLTGGVRHDHHRRFGNHDSLSANGVFSPNAGRTIIRASYGEGFKAPSLFQLYSDYGNETLRPETSKSWDVGVTQKLFGEQIEAGLTWFERDSRNLIVYVSCFQSPRDICRNRPGGTYDNVAATRAKGLEASVLVRPTDGLTLQGNYSWVEARNRATGLFLPRRPRHMANVAMDYRLPGGPALGATLTRVGESFDNATLTRRLAPYTLVDLRVSQPLGRNLSLFARVENAFDEKYETVYQYGTTGRAAFGGIRLSY